MSQLSQYLPDLQPVGWLGVVLTACGVCAYGFKVIRALVRITRQAGEFFDDWNGEEARPGFDARPGIPERVSRIEAQMSTNGGLSLKDQTNRIEATLNAHILATKAVPH